VIQTGLALVLCVMTCGGARAGMPDAAQAPDSLSIAQCIALARANAPDVRAASEDLQAARYDSAAATKNRRPIASLFGSVLIAPRGFYDPAITNLGQYEFKAGVTLPLRDGGAASRDRARAANQAALAAFQSRLTAREAGLRAGQLAIEILTRRERERFEAQSLIWIDDLASIIASRVRAGVSGPSDSMRIGLERDVVEAALDSTRTGTAIAQRELAQLLGISVEAMPPLRDSDPIAPLGPTPADSLALIAKVERLPDIGIARAEEAQARLDLADVAHRNDLRIDLSADAGFAGTDLTARVPADMRAADPNASVPDRLRRDLGASAAIDFRRPIVDPTLGTTIAARRSAADAARLRSVNTLSTQRRGALDLLDRWRAANRALHKTHGTVGRSGTNLLRTKSLYIAGAAGILDILDARRILDEAQERLADARSLIRSARIEAENLP